MAASVDIEQAWRRLAEWHAAGVWQQLHELLLAELHAAEKIDWSKAVIDSSHVRARKGGLCRSERTCRQSP